MSHKIPQLSILAQNCNSLNVTCINDICCKKILNIINHNASIVFLSDIRLGAKANVVMDQFRLHYRMFANSTLSRRGVAILIKNNLDFTMVNQYKDTDQNILLLKCKINGTELILGSVYGPNTDNQQFFAELETQISNLNCPRVLLGGDWNTTPSYLAPDINPDVYNMNAIPSKKRSEWLEQVCHNLELCDAYRIANGNDTDFSHVPFGNKKNRSRIDFFLISSSLCGNIEKCTISGWHNKKLFDHKPILLAIGKGKKRGRSSINNRILEHPLFLLTFLLSLYECYIENLSLGTFGCYDVLIRDLCSDLDEIDRRVFLLKEFCAGWDWRSDLSALELELKDRYLREIDVIFENNLGIEFLAGIPKKVEDDIFFEALITKTFSSITRLQRECEKGANIKKNMLLNSLSILRQNFSANEREIQQKETELSGLVEAEIKDKVGNYLKTSIINNEKMTPRFLHLAKSRVTDNLTSVLSDTGQKFENAKERSAYITNFYRELYKKPDIFDDVDFNGCVANFLGPEICNNPTVLGMKLSEEEKHRLDLPLTVEELDMSMKQSNMNSAPGVDGVSNKFIKTVWQWIRAPLLKYAHCCFRKGTLTKTFNTACIKLIPKKGDTGQLKNWRPISLLSCYYKIISRCINTRLGTVIGKITGRCQKAYTPNRYIHEVTINLSNAINHCIENKVPGMIISIDQQKAFDSVLHEFCTDAYRFFGFGENFINMMTTLGDNREACVILEDGSLSACFKLGRGRPQGDCPSPRQYNIGEQICILKIEFDPVIEGIGNNDFLLNVPPTSSTISINNNFTDRPVTETKIGFSREAAGPNLTGKVESFADDANVIAKQKAACVLRLKAILEDFYRISGLRCNVDKTSIMFIGPINLEEVKLIKNLGFKIVTSMKCLGTTFENSAELSTNYDSVISKMRKIAGDWSRFGLSLVGRISISKTFLISQVTYLGEVVVPSDEQLNTMQNICNNFVLKGTPWAEDKLYLRPENGGLGLIKIKDLLESLRCSWMRRITTGGLTDTWRAAFFKYFFFNPNCFRPNLIPPEKLLERGIGDAFWKFCTNFWSTGTNIVHAPIFYNPLVTIGFHENGQYDGRVLDHVLLNTGNEIAVKKKLLSLLISDFLFPNTFTVLDYASFVNKLEHRINFNTYFRVRNAIISALKRYKCISSVSKPVSILQVLCRKGGGSKTFRTVISGQRAEDCKGMNTIQNLSTMLNVDLPDTVTIKSNLSAWNNMNLPVHIRIFALNLVRNSLPVRARLANRYRNQNNLVVDERCRLCLLMPDAYRVPQRETFVHFFWDCPYSAKIINTFNEKYLRLRDPVHIKYAIFFGTMDGAFSTSIRLVTLLLLFEIWNSRLSKFALSAATIDCNILQNFTCIANLNNNYSRQLLTDDNLWFRHWFATASNRE
jgi:exonuclease III